MSTGFVAVLCTEVPEPAELMAAGATAILTWSEVRSCAESDDAIAVLLDQEGELGADLTAVLAAFEAVDLIEAVIVTTRPVTDTLKLVDAGAGLIATAERGDHRFLRTPIALRMRLLRRVVAELDTPTPIAVLNALATQGITIHSAV